MQILIEKKGIKRKKSLVTFNVLIRMAYHYNLPESSKKKIIEWMNEESVKEEDFKGFVEQIGRLICLFPMAHVKVFKIYDQEIYEEQCREAIRNN